MAVTASGIYLVPFIDIFDATQLAIDLTATSHKCALLSNSATPNFDTDTTWNNTNEVTGTGWVTGGIAWSALAAGATSLVPTLTVNPTGSMMLDGNDIAVATTTISNARALRMYADALADQLLFLINLGSDYSTVAGTFGITWAATGILAIDVTP